MLFINLNLYAHTTFTSIPSKSEKVKRNSHEYLMDVAFNVSSGTAVNVGDQICVDVTVDNFTDILAAQFSVNYDPNFLEYVSIGNFGLPGLNENVMGLPSGGTNPGDITVAWTDPTFVGATVSNGTSLFEICFTTLADATTDIEVTGMPTSIQVIDVNTSIIPTTQNAGTITIGNGGSNGGGGGTGDFTFSVSSETASNVGDQVCVDVTVDNFTDILAAQFSVNYDPNILEYVSVGNFGLSGLNQNVMGLPGGGTNAGDITVAWTDPTLGGITVADGTVLFEICFNSLAEATTDIEITSMPTSIQVIDVNTSIVPTTQNTGTITIGNGGGNGGGGGTGDFTFNVSSEMVANVGDQVCVDVTVDNFTNVLAAQFSIDYDASSLEYVSVGNFGLSGLNENVMGLPGGGTNAGDITVAWTDPTLGGVTVSDGTVLFEICFTTLSSGTSTVAVTGSPTAIQVIDSGSNIVSTVQNDGTVTVNGGGGGGGTGDFTFNVSSEMVANVGDQVCVDVTVDNFTNVLAAQFSIDYDASSLEYVSVGNFGLSGLNENVMGLPGGGTNAGDITVAWTDPTLGGVTVSDGTVLFEICFTTLSSGTSTVAVTGSPTAIQVIDSGSNIVSTVQNDGTVTVNGGGGGGGTGDFTFNVSSETVANVGDQVCVDVSVDNFTDIVAIQFSIDYDPAMLQYVSVGNFGLPGLNENVMGLPSGGTNPGDITVAWTEPTLSGVSVPDGTILFEVCFTTLATGTSNVDITGSPTSIQVIDGQNDVVPTVQNNGTVTVNGGGGGGTDDFTFDVTSATANNTGDQVCIDITADNFTDIIAAQFSVNYDPAIIEFVSVGNFGLPGLNENVMGLPSGGTTPGEITVAWTDPTLGGVTVANGTVLFEVCFIAQASGTSPVNVTGTPTSIQVIDSGNSIVPTMQSGGTVTVVGGNPPPVSDDFTLILSDEFTPSSGSSVCLEVTALNFTDIVGMQFSINYNPSKLTYESVGNFGLDGLSENVMGLPGMGTQPGTITVAWTDPTLGGVTVPDNSVLFEVCFTADLTSGTTPVEFSDTPTPIQILDSDVSLVPADIVNGSVSIGDPNSVLVLEIDDATVCADDGEFCVNVSVENFSDIVGMQFSIIYDPTDLDYSSVGNFGLDGLNENVMGLPTGGAGSTSPGVITVAWTDPTLGGVTVPDGTTLFQVCFDALGTDGTSSNVEFSNTPTSIQIIDGNTTQIPFNDLTGVITFDCNQFSAPVIEEPASIVGNDCFGDNNGSISINISGGSGDFSFLWSGGAGNTATITNLVSGNYTVTVTDNQSGQTAIKTFTVPLSGTAITINSINVTDIICPGESSGAINVNASGGAGALSYSWTPVLPAVPNPGGLSAGAFYRVTITDENGCTEVSSFIEVTEPPIINSGAVVSNIQCVGETNGQINLSPTGGSSPLQIEWDGLPNFVLTQTNLSAGTYNVTITDNNNCELVESYIVEEPAEISIQPQVQDVLCAGETNGSITLNISGGTAATAYNVIWGNNALSGAQVVSLAGGTYDVTISDDNNCQITESIDVAIPAPLALNSSVEDVLCAGENSGIITLNITGGTPNPSYNIDWGGPLPDNEAIQTSLPANTYPVTVTDANGCMESENIVVEEPNNALVVTASIEGVTCEGGPTGSISLNITGGTVASDYDIDWETLPDGLMMQENLESGAYTVSVSDDSGCVTTESFIVNSDAAIFINGDVTDIACAGENTGEISITVAGGSQSFDIAWSGVGTTPTGTQQAELSGGIYNVTVTDIQSGCEKIESFTVVEPEELAATAEIGNVDCFGNATGSIILDISGGTENYTVDWASIDIPQNELMPSDLVAGVYDLTITDANGCELSQSIDIEQSSEIIIEAELVNISCNGDETGSIIIDIQGGTPSYTEDWESLTDNETEQLNLAAGIYNLTVIDLNGCEETVSFELTEPDPINISQNIVNYINSGNDGLVDISVEGGVDPYGYLWTGPAMFSSTQQDLTNLDNTGEYCVTITDDNSCIHEQCFDVLRALDFGIEQIQFTCANESNGSISLEIIGGREPFTFDWSVAGSDDSPILEGISNGTYSVTVTDAEGTTITGSFDVGEFPEFFVTESITPALGLINNTNGAISLDLSGGVEPFDVQWDNGMSGAEISGLMEGTYCAIITDGNGCTIEACYEVEFVSLPFIIEELNPIETNCSGETNGRLFIKTGGGIPPYELTININGTNVMFTSLNGEFEVEGLAAGTYDISIVDGNGDVQTSQEEIVEPDPITVNVTVRHDTELTGPGSGSGRIDLGIVGGTPAYNVIWLGTAFQGVSAINLNAEFYTPRITDSRGCEITLDEIEVEEFAIDLEGTDAFCAGDENGLIDLVITDGDAPYTFTWTNPDGSTITTEDLENIPAGTYEVTVTESSGNTLIESITIGTQSNLTIMADVLSDYNGFDVSCLDATDGQVSANAIFNGTDCDDCSFEWELNGNLESVDATLTDAASGTYTIMVIDPLGCENIQEIELSAPPQMQLNANIQEVSCPGEEDGVITVTVVGGVGGFFNYNWSNGAASFQNTDLASGVYALTTTDANACTASTSFEVAEPIALEVSIQTEEDNDPDACNGSIWAVVNGGNPPYSYDWNAFAVDPTVSLVENVCPGGDYVVTVTDVRGCSAVVGNIIVRDGSVDCLEERIVITPDGNGSNDEFIINCIEELQDTHLEVYNRWGQLVFETDNYDNTWEGTSQNGELLPEGPYFFVLDYRDNGSGNMTQFRGSLTILKE